jgi:serine/threonine-protein kinase
MELATPTGGELPDLSADGYQIIQKVGEGGMGTVYKAQNLILQRPAALKILKPSLTGDPASLRRLLNEGRLLAKIEHPNILRIYDVRTSEKMTCLCLEWVEGGSLLDVLRQGKRLAAQDAVNYLVQAARGLEAAHKAGVVHRDIKPGNLMLTSDGTVKIADFGLARAVAAEVGVSRIGRILGTPLYMSPEQAHGKEADARSDIYCLGASFFHLLAGRPPFTGAGLNAVLKQHIQSPLPELSDINPDVPPALEDVITRMMAKSPEKRFEDGGALLRELERLSRETAFAQRAVRKAGPPPSKAPSPAKAEGEDLFAALAEAALPSEDQPLELGGELSFVKPETAEPAAPVVSTPPPAQATAKLPKQTPSAPLELLVEEDREKAQAKPEEVMATPAAPAGEPAEREATGPEIRAEDPFLSERPALPEQVEPRPDKCPHCSAGLSKKTISCPACGKYVPSLRELRPPSELLWHDLFVSSLLDPLSGQGPVHLALLSGVAAAGFAAIGVGLYALSAKLVPAVSVVGMAVYLAVVAAFLLGFFAERTRLVMLGYEMSATPGFANPKQAMRRGRRVLLHAVAMGILPLLSGLVSSSLQILLLSLVALGYPLSLLFLLSGRRIGQSLHPGKWARLPVLVSRDCLPAIAGAAILLGILLPIAAAVFCLIFGFLAHEAIAKGGGLIQGLIGVFVLTFFLFLIAQYGLWVAGSALARAWRRNTRFFEHGPAERPETAETLQTFGLAFAGMLVLLILSIKALYPIAGWLKGGETVKRLIFGPAAVSVPVPGAERGDQP